MGSPHLLGERCVEDVTMLDPIFNDLEEQYAQFGCELRMDFMSAFQGFLQKDRDGETIGIVVIDLSSLMPDK